MCLEYRVCSICFSGSFAFFFSLVLHLSGVLTSEGKITDILDKGKGALIIMDGKHYGHDCI